MHTPARNLINAVILSIRMERPCVWDALSVALIAAACVLMIVRRDIFPIFQDIYYHLAVARSFLQAGGVSTVDFLQYAPFGRPNLYPPLYHVALSAPLSSGSRP